MEQKKRGPKIRWDTEKGFELYLQGKTSEEIAEACGVSLNTIKNYRTKHWNAETDSRSLSPSAAQTAPPVQEEPLDAPKNFEIESAQDAMHWIESRLQRLEAFEQLGLDPEELGRIQQSLPRLVQAVEQLQLALREVWYGKI